MSHACSGQGLCRRGAQLRGARARRAYGDGDKKAFALALARSSPCKFNQLHTIHDSLVVLSRTNQDVQASRTFMMAGPTKMSGFTRWASNCMFHDSSVVRSRANQECQDLCACFDGGNPEFQAAFSFGRKPSGQARSFRSSRISQQGTSGFATCVQQPKPGVSGLTWVCSSRPQKFEDSNMQGNRRFQDSQLSRADRVKIWPIWLAGKATSFRVLLMLAEGRTREFQDSRSFASRPNRSFRIRWPPQA